MSFLALHFSLTRSWDHVQALQEASAQDRALVNVSREYSSLAPVADSPANSASADALEQQRNAGLVPWTPLCPGEYNERGAVALGPQQNGTTPLSDIWRFFCADLASLYGACESMCMPRSLPAKPSETCELLESYNNKFTNICPASSSVVQSLCHVALLWRRTLSQPTHFSS